MIVEKVELILIEKELVRPFTTSFGTVKKRKILLIKLHTDTELGWGECVAGNGPWFSYETYETAWIVIDKYLSKLVIGRNFNTPQEFHEAMETVRGHNMAKAALEAAFFDAYAKWKKVPLYRLLGGVREEVVSGVSLGIQKTIGDLIDLIKQYLDKGYQRIKIKIKPNWDLEPVKRIREELGDIPLQVDANAAYSISDMEIFKELDKYNLLMIEQPFHYEDLVDHAQLQKNIETPVCLDESIDGFQRARAALSLGSCKVINIKPGRVGGIINSLAIHDLAKKENVGVWIGGMLETGIGRALLVALATLPNVKYPNDVSASDRYWEEDIVEPEFKLSKRGTISVPKGYGIGVDVNEEAIYKLSLKRKIIM
ncbi:MAG: o-succinylbenzoate synthase [Candidatus Njordarchaeia archaeon]